MTSETLLFSLFRSHSVHNSTIVTRVQRITGRQSACRVECTSKVGLDEGVGARGRHSFMMSARDRLGRNNGGLRGALV